MSKNIHFIKGKGNYDFEIVHEEEHLKNIQLVCSDFVKPGQFKEEIAIITSEGNHYLYDNTFRVDIAGKTVGYLNQDDTKLFTRRLNKDDKHNLIMSCNARIFVSKNKGMFKKVRFTIKLDLPITKK